MGPDAPKTSELKPWVVIASRHTSNLAAIQERVRRRYSPHLKGLASRTSSLSVFVETESAKHWAINRSFDFAGQQ
jgi:hypothetical protein